MTNATVSNEEKFGALIYRLAKERVETSEGAKELEGFRVEQFLDTLEQFTKVIDNLPGTYDMRSVYLALNWLGANIVQIMEKSQQELMRQTGGSA